MTSEPQFSEAFLPLLEERRQEEYRTIHRPRLLAALQNKHVWNVDYTELKEWLNWALGGCPALNFRRFEANFLNTPPGTKGSTPELWVIDGIHTASDIVSKAARKRIADTAKKHPKYAGLCTAWAASLDIFAPLVEAVISLKPYIEKGRKPNPNAVPAYVPPRAAVKDLARVETLLREVTDGLRQRMIDSAVARHTQLAADYFENRKDEWQSPGNFHYLRAKAKRDALTETHRKWMNSQYGPVREGRDTFLDTLCDTAREFPEKAEKYHNGGRTRYTRRDDAGATILDRATREVEDIQMRFLAKMLGKLTTLIAEKGKQAQMREAKVLELCAESGTFTGRLFFNFLDGSSFRVDNSIVYKSSPRGKQFQQYPTTFHDVRFADGAVMPLPSEERMNKEFAKR